MLTSIKSCTRCCWRTFRHPLVQLSALATWASGLLDAYVRCTKTHPFTTSILTCGVQMTAANATMQFIDGRRPLLFITTMPHIAAAADPFMPEDIDWLFMLAMTVYGLTWAGPWHVLLYRLYDHLLAPGICGGTAKPDVNPSPAKLKLPHATKGLAACIDTWWNASLTWPPPEYLLIAGGKVALDQLIAGPLLFIPAFYLITGAVQLHSLTQIAGTLSR